MKETIIRAKNFDDLSEFLSPGDGAEDFTAIVKAIESRKDRRPVFQLEDPDWLALNEKRKEREASVASQPQPLSDAISEPDSEHSRSWWWCSRSLRGVQSTRGIEREYELSQSEIASNSPILASHGR